MRKFRTLRFRKRPRPSATRIEQFSRAYDQFHEERRLAASGEVDALLRQTRTDKLSELVENPILRTLGAVQYLGTIFAQTLTSDPQRANAIAELEVSLAENLSPTVYHRIAIIQSRCYAWRDIGIALRALGRLDQSLQALAMAEWELLQYGSLLHDLAIVRLSVAMTLQELERFEEARALIAECKRLFIDYADDQRVVLASFCEGVLLQRMKHHREARETYLFLLDSGLPVEPSVLAAIHRAIGFASIDLGNYADAETNLIRSIELHRQLAEPIEVARSQYAFGRLLIRRGDAAQAITYLRPVRREFLQHALIEEAGLCGLEIVEAMLSLGNHAAAETLSRNIIGEFMRAGFNKRAITALGYLQEAIASSQASTRLVNTIREYIVSLRTSPERDFLPLRITASPETSPER